MIRNAKGRVIRYPSELPAGTCRPKLWMLEYVCERMRGDEIDQYLAITGAKEFNPQVAAAGFMHSVIGPANIAIAHLDELGAPTCIGGYALDSNVSGVWQSWMAGTQEGWDKHWRAITRSTKWAIAQLLDGHARRLETTVLASRTHAIEWYTESLGLKLEGTRRCYTEDGRDLQLFGLTKQDWFADEEY